MDINDREIRTFAQMGIAALIPGMEYALEIMQGQLNEMRAQIAQLQGGEPAARRSGKKGGRAGWSEDPEERKREMARRVAKRAVATKRAAMTAARKREWAEMTPRKRTARLKAMMKGRKRKLEEAEAAAA